MRCRNENLRNIRHNSGTAVDTHQVCGRVQRSKVDAQAQLIHNLGGNEAGLEEVRTAVDNAVTDSFDFAHILDTAVVCIGQRVDEDLRCDSVVGHVKCQLDLSAVGQLVGDLTVDGDAFADTFCQNVAALHIKQLILQRGASGIDNQNLHNKFSSNMKFCYCKKWIVDIQYIYYITVFKELQDIPRKFFRFSYFSYV